LKYLILSAHVNMTNKIFPSIRKLRIAVKQYNIIHTILLKQSVVYKYYKEFTLSLWKHD